jgi:hypothetical protein
MPDDNRSPAPYRALVGLLAIGLMVVGVVFVMYRLHEAAKLQDCFASGRTNCLPIETGH